MSDTPNALGAGPTPKSRSQPTRKLPTDRIAYGKMLDIMRAYGVASQGGTKPVHYSEAAKIVQMSPATVGLMNTFLIDSAFVEKSGNDFIPNRALIEFAQAYSWAPDAAPKKLAPLLKKTWFGNFLLGRLAFRPMPNDEAVTELAGQVAATPDLRPQIETLIALLVTSGLIRQEGGSLYLTNIDNSDLGQEAHPPRAEKQPEAEPVQDRQGDLSRAPSTSRTVATGFSSAAGRVQLHVNIDVSMEEMGGWSPDRITAFFAGLAQVLAAKKGAEEIK